MAKPQIFYSKLFKCIYQNLPNGSQTTQSERKGYRHRVKILKIEIYQKAGEF